MSINISRLTIKHFDPDSPRCHTETEGSFKVYTLVKDGKNTTFEDIKNLEVNDRKPARSAYTKLFNRTDNIEPLDKNFHGREYHKGHEFQYQGDTIAIWRLWLAGTIRIYFIFTPPKNILILKTLAKRKEDLNESEKKRLENMVKEIINCQKNNNVIEI